MVDVYSVYDNERKIYANPFFTDGSGDDTVAIRIFKAQLFDRQNLIAMFPDKFELHFIGQFDEDNGTFKFDDSWPLLVITGTDALEELKNEPVQD